MAAKKKNKELVMLVAENSSYEIESASGEKKSVTLKGFSYIRWQNRKVASGKVKTKLSLMKYHPKIRKHIKFVQVKMPPHSK